MGIKKLFLDSYALCEIAYGNLQYIEAVSDARITLTQLNLAEYYYHLILNYGKEHAEKLTLRFEEYCVPFSTQTIMEAMDFRKTHKKRKLSYTDCIGYTVAVKSGALFLTGDKEFKDLPHVLFVK